MELRRARVLRKSRSSRLGDCAWLAGPPTAVEPATAGGPPSGQAGAKAANLIGQEHVNNVAGFAATDEAERTEDDEAADRFTHGAGADADAAGEPGHGEA